MNTINTQDLILQCIKDRTMLSEPKLSLRRMLKSNNTEAFIRPCAEAIRKDNLINGTDIDINVADVYDLQLSAKGICLSNHILNRYCDAKKLDDYTSMLIKVKNIYDNINDQLGVLFTLSLGSLVKFVRGKDLENVKKETADSIIACARAEIIARLPHNRIKWHVKRLLRKIKTIWKYRKVYIIAIVNRNLLKGEK